MSNYVQIKGVVTCWLSTIDKMGLHKVDLLCLIFELIECFRFFDVLRETVVLHLAPDFDIASTTL